MKPSLQITEEVKVVTDTKLDKVTSQTHKKTVSGMGTNSYEMGFVPDFMMQKWDAESKGSEKKEIYDKYKEMCKDSKKGQILFKFIGDTFGDKQVKHGEFSYEGEADTKFTE